MLAVRWYLRFDLSYRDVEELLAERGVEVDHGTMYRWAQRSSAPPIPPRNQGPFKSRRPGASRRTNQTRDRFHRLRMARARSGRSV